MCIPFICRLCLWGCLGGFVLVVCWLKYAPFSFLLVSPFRALWEFCIALSRRSCAHFEERCPGRSEDSGVLCKQEQGLVALDTLLRGMVIPDSYSFLCIVVDCQDDLFCCVHVPYGDILLRKLYFCCCCCYDNNCIKLCTYTLRPWKLQKEERCIWLP